MVLGYWLDIWWGCRCLVTVVGCSLPLARREYCYPSKQQLDIGFSLGLKFQGRGISSWKKKHFVCRQERGTSEGGSTKPTAKATQLSACPQGLELWQCWVTLDYQPGPVARSELCSSPMCFYLCCFLRGKGFQHKGFVKSAIIGDAWGVPVQDEAFAGRALIISPKKELRPDVCELHSAGLLHLTFPSREKYTLCSFSFILALLSCSSSSAPAVNGGTWHFPWMLQWKEELL